MLVKIGRTDFQSVRGEAGRIGNPSYQSRPGYCGSEGRAWHGKSPSAFLSSASSTWPWGRKLLIAWGVLEILVILAGIVYSIAVVQPGTQKAMEELDQWTKRIEAEQNKGAPPGPKRPGLGAGGGMDPIVSAIITVAV